MTDTTTRKKKLIEVALPLDEINAACKADKDRKTGTIRNLHKWFAPMPLPAWRALLFAALVDDPEDDNQRVYLLDLIKRLVANGADLPAPADLAEAKRVLSKGYPDKLPLVLDPFCGGGSTLVEAQRLGLPTQGSDLNPVPVLITKTLTELLPSVAWTQSLHSAHEYHEADSLFAATAGTESGPFSGIVSDVHHYARRIAREAGEVLREHYPATPGETAVAWIWARTARCQNPTCGVETVLTTSWWLSKKRNDMAWVVPSVADGQVKLQVHQAPEAHEVPPPPKSSRGANFVCVGCNATLTERQIEEQARDGGSLGLRLVACVVERNGKRVYRAPTEDEVAAAETPLDGVMVPDNVPVNDGGSRKRFGLDTQADLYTPRQLRTLTVFADLVALSHTWVKEDGGSDRWATTVSTLLGLALGRLAMSNSTQARVTIRNDGTTTRFNAAFGRNDLPMTWDFPELNPLGGEGTWLASLPTILDALNFVEPGEGVAFRADARHVESAYKGLVATDPPYFDAIGYADLSDYFYVWHRRALRDVHPELYGTMAAPKQNELTALPSHHGNSKEAARQYFIAGFTETFRNLQESMLEGLPLLVVYASREQKAGSEETRWSSILTAMMAADLEITATWPIHGTGPTRMVGQGANAVASYIVMACHARREAAGTTSLTDFTRALRRELGPAVRDLQAASILPVDLAQAAMGPGMQIFSRYRAVLDQAGQAIQVDQALRLINSALSEVLDEQEGELDRESRFAVRWWESHGWASAAFGDADKTVRPLGIGVDDVVRAQVALSQANRVRLLGRHELDREWMPDRDKSPTAWEAVHHLADRLIDGGGELEASKLMARLGSLQDSAMALTYRLHDIAAKKGRTADQERYNALINSWAELVRLSGDSAATMEGLF